MIRYNFFDRSPILFWTIKIPMISSSGQITGVCTISPCCEKPFFLWLLDRGKMLFGNTQDFTYLIGVIWECKYKNRQDRIYPR